MDVSVPVDLTVEYRYLVVQPITTGDKTALRVLRRETTIHPRQICLRETGTREAKEGKGVISSAPGDQNDQ